MTTNNSTSLSSLPTSARRAVQRGFSFIEILVVMGIIAVLTGGVLVVIGIMADKRPIFDTQQTLKLVEGQIHKFKMDFGRHPPSKLSKISKVTGREKSVARSSNTVNEGIEAVYQSLTWPGFKGSIEFKESMLGNIDDDDLRKAVNKLGQTTAYEILDGYGNPFIYIHSEDYVRAFESGLAYSSETAEDEPEVLAKPHKRADGSGFVNASGFQIYSMGADGLPNTDDDIASWKDD